MKKLSFLIVFICLFLILPVWANSNDFAALCPQTPEIQGIKISKITGMKWISEQIAQEIIKREIKKEVKGKFKVTIKSSGTKDLSDGKFNFLSVTGKNLNAGGAHISYFNTNTVCDFNSVKRNKNDLLFRENMVLNYELKFDNDALLQTTKDMKYVEVLNSMGFPLNSMTTQIRNNRIYFIFEIPTFITSPIKLTLSSGLTIRNGRVQLTGIHTENNSILNVKNLVYILEKVNPISFTSDIMGNNRAIFAVDSAKIINDVIVIKGLMFIPKNT